MVGELLWGWRRCLAVKRILAAVGMGGLCGQVRRVGAVGPAGEVEAIVCVCHISDNLWRCRHYHAENRWNLGARKVGCCTMSSAIDWSRRCWEQMITACSCRLDGRRGCLTTYCLTLYVKSRFCATALKLFFRIYPSAKSTLEIPWYIFTTNQAAHLQRIRRTWGRGGVALRAAPNGLRLLSAREAATSEGV